MSEIVSLGAILDDIKEEIKGAQAKFPGNKHRLAALVEEVGELHQAMLQHDHDGESTSQDIYKEAIQVAAMAIRIAIEGDAAFSYVLTQNCWLEFKPTGS